MFFVLDENKNLIEGYDKEGVLALLEQAIEDGDLSGIEADSAFVSKLKSLVNGTTHHIEFVTQAQYNAIEQAGTLVPNTYYFITDDDTAEDLENAVNGILDGTTAVPNATEANHATSAEDAENAEKVNNLAITRDANGVLKIGDIIIPQKQLLWSSANGHNLVDNLNISENWIGKTIEIVWSDDTRQYKHSIVTLSSNNTQDMVARNVFVGSDGVLSYAINVRVSTTNTGFIALKSQYPSSATNNMSCYIYKIYEIIE